MSIIPDYTKLIDADKERALVASFIDHMEEDSQAEMRSFDADQDRDEAAIKAAFPRSPRNSMPSLTP